MERDESETSPSYLATEVSTVCEIQLISIFFVVCGLSLATFISFDDCTLEMPINYTFL